MEPGCAPAGEQQPESGSFPVTATQGKMGRRRLAGLQEAAHAQGCASCAAGWLIDQRSGRNDFRLPFEVFPARPPKTNP